jgi:hypothetical protein
MKADDVSTQLDRHTRNGIAKLRQYHCSENLKSLLNLSGFKDICASLTTAEGTQAEMMVEYMKDVSAMLCLIVAVREKSIETHLAAE